MSSVVKTFVLGNRFFDSLKLMRISTRARELERVDKVSVVMATDLNKQILREVGYLRVNSKQQSQMNLWSLFQEKMKAILTRS